MERRAWGRIAGSFIGVCLLLCLALWYYAGTSAFVQSAGEMVSKKATEALETKVEIGGVKIASPWTVSADGIVLYDKQGNLLAKAESAEMRFSLFDILRGRTTGAVNEVLLHRLEASLCQDKSGRWNYQDLLKEDEEKSDFAAKVRLTDSAVSLDMAGKKLRAEKINALLDCADMDDVGLEAEAELDGTPVRAEGRLGRQLKLALEAGAVQAEKYLNWLPEGTVPEGVAIRQLKLDKIKAKLEQREGKPVYQGELELLKGELTAAGVEITDAKGRLALNEAQELRLDVSAALNKQPLSASGKVKLAADPQLDLRVRTKGFDPAEVMEGLPFKGAVELEAEVQGTVASPSVSAKLAVQEGELMGFGLKGIKAEAAYLDGRLVVQRLKGEALGGTMELSGELFTDDLYFDGHALLNGINLAELNEYLPEAGGALTADLGFKGKGDAVDELSLYGDVRAKDASYMGIGIPELHGSFYQQGQDITFDYLNIMVENGGELGLEGTIKNGRELDLAYFASHFDLSLIKTFVPEADLLGFSDFEGTVKGDSSNPVVRGRLAALNGKLFKQPFRSLHGEFGGNMRGVRIKNFEMETAGKVTWTIKGDIGFLGDRYVDLQIDTMGARMEDIAALVAPDQPITGVVDNIITIKGTMADPDIVGYIHFYQGSYNGYLLSGMDGDYTVKNGLATLQDFHVFSPLVDMVLNGTVDFRSQVIDLHVAAKDLDLQRFGGKLPYPINGHGVFDGRATGTLNKPVFDGKLTAGVLDFNGVLVTDAYGSVRYESGKVFLSPLSFKENGGSYVLNAWADVNTKKLDGMVTVKNGDIHSILTVLNNKELKLSGRLDGEIKLAGTVDDPRVGVYAHIGSAAVGGYELSDVSMDASYAERKIRLDRFEGRQGMGTFAGVGSIDLDGAMALRFSAGGVQCGIIPAAAGVEFDTQGILNIEADFGGTVQHPVADMSFEITNGGVRGAVFDTMTGLVNVYDDVIHLQQLVVKKEQAGKRYSISAQGRLPFRALTAEAEEELTAAESLDVKLALDEGDMSMLPSLSKQIDWAIGETYGAVHVGGSAAAPQLDGTIGLKDGAVKIKEMGLPVTGMNISLVCDGTHIELADCSGKIGSGTYRMLGKTDLSGLVPVNYNLKLTANKLDIDLPYYKGPLTVDCDVFEDSFYGKRLPKLRTNILLQDVVLGVPDIPESEGDLPEFMLDVTLELGKHVRFYNSSFANLWLGGRIHYGGTTRYIQPSGSVYVERGTVSYMRNDFRIREGTAAFNQVGSFLPSLSFFADTRLNRTKIYLSISGPAEAWKLRLTSSPQMSEADIIKLLTLRNNARSGENNDNQLNDLLLAGLQMAFLGEIEDAMKDLLMLDEFNIKRDSDFIMHNKELNDNSKDNYDVQIGKYLNEKVLLEYTHGINSERRRVGVKYEFNDRFSIAVGHDNMSKYWMGLEARIPF